MLGLIRLAQATGTVATAHSRLGLRPIQTQSVLAQEERVGSSSSSLSAIGY